MFLANFDRIRSAEMVRLVVDFLTISGSLVNLRSQRRTRAMRIRVDVLGPTPPGVCDAPLGTIFVSRGS